MHPWPWSSTPYITVLNCIWETEKDWGWGVRKIRGLMARGSQIVCVSRLPSTRSTRNTLSRSDEIQLTIFEKYYTRRSDPDCVKTAKYQKYQKYTQSLWRNTVDQISWGKVIQIVSEWRLPSTRSSKVPSAPGWQVSRGKYPDVVRLTTSITKVIFNTQYITRLGLITIFFPLSDCPYPNKDNFESKKSGREASRDLNLRL